jgi:hypothetical protein
MDNDITDLKRRAGITEETYSMSAYEEYLQLINSEYEFLGQLAQVISKTMAPNNSRQVIGAIKNRRTEMEKLHRVVLGKSNEKSMAENAYQDKETDSRSYGKA